MTLIPPNVAALIEEARSIGNWSRHETGPEGDDKQGPTLFARLVFALEAAYATPRPSDTELLAAYHGDEEHMHLSESEHVERLRRVAALAPSPARSLPTVVEISEAIYDKGAYCGNCEYTGMDDCDDCRLCCEGYARAVLALFAREGEAK